MKLPTSFCLSLLERFVAGMFLVLLLPVLLLIALLIHQTGGSPVIVTVELPGGDGTTIRRSYRFRTTGRGTSFFPTIGRVLRLFTVDEFLGLWSVMLGHIRLRDFLRNRRPFPDR
jgi:lipopolysaccharide/colanic/teichoic acid biosynthesis glycosyltransferase